MRNVSQQAELEEFILEAHKVQALANSEGWSILKRDCLYTIEGYKKSILSMDKNDSKFDDLRIQTLACEKLLAMVEDYEANRKKAEELFLKLNLPEEVIIADVDNHSPLLEKD